MLHIHFLSHFVLQLLFSFSFFASWFVKIIFPALFVAASSIA
tara:strand:- start:155 stop:280 length:126 start_codon:yes stop_codon:yes gene_type:complete